MTTPELQDVELKVEPCQEGSVAAATHLLHHGDTLEVSGLPDTISEELLDMYFENSRSGGCADGVKKVSFVRPGVAQIQFISDTGTLLE